MFGSGVIAPKIGNVRLQLDPNMNILAVLIARGSSKRVPRKNIRLLGKYPLIAHSIMKLNDLSKTLYFDHVVSTDDVEIRSISESFGGYCPFLRPEELARDNVPSLPVVQHAVNFMSAENNKVYDVIVYIQPTSPFWRIDDFLRCITVLSESHYVSCLPVTKVETHPFKMKRLLDDGRLINLIDQGVDDMRPYQDLPTVMRRAGSLYATRTDIVMNHDSLIGDPCFGFEVPLETAVDIDTPMDFAMAQVIYDQYSNLNER